MMIIIARLGTAIGAVTLPVSVGNNGVNAEADISMDHAETGIRDGVEVCVDHRAGRHTVLTWEYGRTSHRPENVGGQGMEVAH